ncbi:hypothetical protein GCM10009775_25510 [Microbacterium aoyamense]|uniref:Lipoprotein n=1 Tax=Microbacterium aoyamense TaxID=344166 RepID=A0ABP5B8Z2_9MICO|nr:hypothetical protein [Microbacterium aoyamense]
MSIRRIAAVAVLAVAFALTACTSAGTPVIAPVTMDVNDLQGATVDLKVGQVLNINTGSLAVTSYSGEVEDTSIAEFVKGSDTQDAQFNPGVKGLAEGSTKVVLSNSDGGIEDVTFTVDVTS